MSGSFSILLNGVSGKQFYCKRGVRQGDPIFPILYVLGGYILQLAVNDLHHSLVIQITQLFNMLMTPY